MANYPHALAQDAACQSHTGHITGLWFLPSRPLRLNTNKLMMNLYINIYMLNTTLDRYSGFTANQLWEVLNYTTLQQLRWLKLHIFRTSKITHRTKRCRQISETRQWKSRQCKIQWFYSHCKNPIDNENEQWLSPNEQETTNTKLHFIVSPCIFIYLLVFTNVCTFIVIKILHKQSLM